MLDKHSQTHEQLLAALQERAKELDCLYHVEETLHRHEGSLEDAFAAVLEVIGPGWQHSGICRVAVKYGDLLMKSQEFEPTPWVLSSDILVRGEIVGRLEVYYMEERPQEDVGPFLKEETQLIRTIAGLLGHFILHQRLSNMQESLKAVRKGGTGDTPETWRGPLALLRESDRALYTRINRKMLNHLCQIGIPEAQGLLTRAEDEGTDSRGEANVPCHRHHGYDALLFSGQPFELAGHHLSDEEILSRVQNWMQEDKASNFLRVLNNPRSPLPEIADAMRRFQHGIPDTSMLRPSTIKTLRVSLTQRLLTEQLDFVRVAKDHVAIADFDELCARMIIPADSHGRLGGKSAGMLLAHRILTETAKSDKTVGEIRIPKTWYVPSDGVLAFVGHNDLQDVIEQKFKETAAIREEYPDIIRLFKNSTFPPRMMDGLSVALDDFEDTPIIIRSSSILEDRLGTAFSGKYKSLFLANQGSKRERLEALADAIAEVYASTFGPDPIEYRRERGLLEFNEEMGILIQEVVGTRIGKYFFPAFAGVAFSNNEFRWSPRIKREDGLIRMVPGLGTRAVDRVGDDFPVLLVPGQPKLRVNVAIDEIIRYSPRWIDVINLETGTLETKDLSELLREMGTDFPAIEKVFSILQDGMLQKATRLIVDPDKDEMIATFNGLVDNTPFVQQLRTILRILEHELGAPVDIEFAHDGSDFYLLQCRPQGRADESAPAPIPKDVSEADVIFTAKRFVSNGSLPDTTHIVYVDPARYGELSSREEMLAVARAVGKLNVLLPKRRFILMGPGRWGSRGDMKLGVNVTYADISNAAMLIEIARRKDGYVPDLSFGTHFFQDLVESRIRYLPLYPDDENVSFNERFLLATPNLLPTILPEFAHLADVVRVIDVPAAADGRVLRVLLNADLDEALAFLSSAGEEDTQQAPTPDKSHRRPLQYWQWRLRMAEQIASDLDAERFGVAALYVFGSTKNATAGPASDIDLLIHFRGSDEQRTMLLSWLEGWGLCLSEINYLRTGYETENLLDIHIITDEDIANGTSFAVRINAVTDAARELPLRSS